MLEDRYYKKNYHLIFVTHNRSTFFLNKINHQIIEGLLQEVFKEKEIKVFIYKILSDHVHILLEKPKGTDLFWIVKLIKGITTYRFFRKCPDIEDALFRSRIWAKGYRWEEVKKKKQYQQTYLYKKKNKDPNT